jgi:hypothetical protein
MARKETTRNVRVAETTATRAEAHADLLGWSFNRFGEKAIEILCDMIEHPEKRVLPDCVRMLDTLRTTKAPALEGVTILENMADVVENFPPSLAKAAEDPTPFRKKNSAAG